MRDRAEVIRGLEVCVSREPGGDYICYKCPYEIDGNDCEINSIKDAIALLKEQETSDTGKARIFQCEKCGYGFNDIFLIDEHNYDIEPHYCPNCGRSVKRNV